MRRVFGPRTAVEAAFLVAVPIVVGVVVGAGMWTIVAASAVAYLLIVLVEAFLWYEGKRAPASPRRAFLRPRSVIVRRAHEEAPAPAAAEEESMVVRPRVEPEAEALPAPPPEPFPAPQAEPEPIPEPAAPVRSSEHVRVLRREPEPAAEPVEPEPERAPLVAVPAPEPEPAQVAVAPAPAASTVVPIGVGSGPRRWNLWDLERLSRESAGGDAARDEERTFLLMYLREFADADGLLPVDFDGLVRDSFGDLVGSR